MRHGKISSQHALFGIYIFLWWVTCVAGVRTSSAQCEGIATTSYEAAHFAAHATSTANVAILNPSYEYSLAELVDIAERNNPQTRIAWERAKQGSERLGMAKSEYFPILVGVAAFQDQRFVNPFPKVLLPRGYSVAETPVVQSAITLQYLLFDFGGRSGEVGAAKAEALAAGANIPFKSHLKTLVVMTSKARWRREEFL